MIETKLSACLALNAAAEGLDTPQLACKASSQCSSRHQAWGPELGMPEGLAQAG